MAARLAIVRGTGGKGKLGSVLGFNRLIQTVPQSPPLSGSIDFGVQSPQPVLPEFSSPSFSFGGSMELMGVPNHKVSRHKRGIRNGPKALKPIPVIVLCNLESNGTFYFIACHRCGPPSCSDVIPQ
ncbi:uncharacterized protein LOC106774000 isoform X2 [Vigna radiata var. radiata]|uniref:Large ribosomal subunit protein bL32m n=1 Tax=Vigna radiata var. radiata TaxID=3916 RepID=A0A3Q0FDJ6_VIGRR|nr:uncharacterized protein LOC106774000 isoform X2 [Vigna radiata var. radiata]